MSLRALLLGLALFAGCATAADDGMGGLSGSDGGLTGEDGSSRRDIPVDCGELALCGVTCADLDTDPDNCGGCARTCVIPGAVAACEGGECVIGSCEAGYADDNGDVLDGCEATASGGGGGGGAACVANTECTTECGGVGATVCEAGVESCGHAGEICNAMDDDCNGQCDEDVAGGCRVGVHRSAGNGHLYTTDAGLAGRAPFHVEAMSYFHIYASPGGALRPVFLCRKPNGRYLITSRTDCEIGVAPTATLGYWSATETCGAVPLYRLYNASAGDHFYTLNATERDNAVAMYGYASEGIAAYVWRAP